MRARQAAVRTLRQARQQLSGFLLCHGRHYHRQAWTLTHRRWLASLKFEQPVHYIVLEDRIAAVEAATARRDRLEAHIEATLPDWSLASVVRALQALRGVAMVSAATLVAELGDITRFTNPRQLMPISAWCHPNTPAAKHVGKVESPKLVTVRHDGC